MPSETQQKKHVEKAWAIWNIKQRQFEKYVTKAPILYGVREWAKCWERNADGGKPDHKIVRVEIREL